MLDIRYIRENPDTVKEFSRQKGYDVDVHHVLTVDEQRRDVQQKMDVLRTERNSIADVMKKAQGKPDQEQIERGRVLKTEIASLEHSASATYEAMAKTIRSRMTPG